MINIQNAGKQFETSFKDSVPDDTYFLRLVDPPSSWGNNTNLRFSAKNPYDCLLYYKPNLFPFELKSTKSTSFSFKGSSPMIKPHQIKSLTEVAQYEGTYPGFIFNFREPTQRTYFLHIDNFNKFLVDTSKSSINENDIKNYGGIEVQGRLKKIKYVWNLIDLLKNIKEMA